MKEDKQKRILEDEFEPTDSDFRFNRRDFLQTTGAGIFVLFTVGDLEAALQRRGGRDYPADFNAYLRIKEDGRVSCFTGKIEMGQGIITSFAQMIAEELDIAVDSVDMVMGDTLLCPWDSSTTGSRSTKYFGPSLRRAGAEARAVLLQLASEKLKLPLDQLIVKDGIVRDKKDNKKISYADLARGNRIERHVSDVPIKHYSKHIVSGKAHLRSDAVEKLTGKAKFAGDIRLPGMLYAKVLRPPSHDAKLINVDISAAEQVIGARVIHDGDLVAILHPNPEDAEKALSKIKAQFEEADLGINDQNIFEHLQASASGGNVVEEKGNLDEGKKQATLSKESIFFNHYVAHAPMEPHTVMVDIGKEKVRVWASTQAPFRVQGSVAQTLNISEEKVHVKTPFVGGGYGGKKSGLDVIQATRLAKLTGKPVQIALSRKEEFFYDTFRPAAVIKLKSGIDKSGKITYWDYDNYFAGSRSSEPIYNIPHFRVFSRGGRDVQLFETGAWRGPGSNTNVFAMESQTDILAHAAGMDPLSFRLKNLTDERMIHVLKAAADKFGKTFSKGPSGKGFGIACTNYLNTYVVTMAQVNVDKNNGTVQVERMVCAQDMGELINPQGAKLQIEGGLTMGLGYALTEEIKFKNKKVLIENFDSYEFTRFSGTPKIEVVLINNLDLPPQGCGEPAITTSGAVIANAIYDAVGARLFTLPMTRERIIEEIKRS
jgi:isoquinoline 1-oxidoreductase